MNEFESIGRELLSLIEEWEPKLSALGNDVIAERRNSQNRTIKISHGISNCTLTR